MIVLNKMSYPVELLASDGDRVIVPTGAKSTRVDDKFNWKLDTSKIKVIEDAKMKNSPVVVPSVPNSPFCGEKYETMMSRDTARGNSALLNK